MKRNYMKLLKDCLKTASFPARILANRHTAFGYGVAMLLIFSGGGMLES